MVGAVGFVDEVAGGEAEEEEEGEGELEEREVFAVGVFVGIGVSWRVSLVSELVGAAIVVVVVVFVILRRGEPESEPESEDVSLADESLVEEGVFVDFAGFKVGSSSEDRASRILEVEVEEGLAVVAFGAGDSSEGSSSESSSSSKEEL